MIFTTFGISIYEQSSEILRNQARELNIFRKVLTPTLDNDFIEKYKDFMNANIKGCGYYIWKPYILLKSIQECEEGEALFYCDAGCRFGTSAKERLFIWFEMLKNNSKNILGFTLNGCPELSWTKIDTIHAIYPDISETDLQILSGIMIFINNEFTRNFIKEWYEWCIKDNHHYITDVPSHAPSHKMFNQHRHDQSVFSLMFKKYKEHVITIPDETWPPDEDKPVRALRAII
jgi:hypothetical protein